MYILLIHETLDVVNGHPSRMEGCTGGGLISGRGVLSLNFISHSNVLHSPRSKGH